MNRRPDAPDPLSPEERELAQRLLRLGPSDGPSPALDARILAAAHAAVATQPPRLRERSRQRWPMWIGVAASLSLAVGIAWQLRPAATTMEAAQQEQDTAVVARMQAEPAADSGGAQSAEAQAEAAAAPAAASATDSVAAPQRPAEVAPGAGMAADRAADAATPAAMKPAAEAVPPAAPKATVANEAAKRSRAEAPASAAATAASDARAPAPLRRGQAAPAEYELKVAAAVVPPPPPPAPPATMGVMSAPAPVDAAPAADAGWAAPTNNLSSKRAAKAAAVAADAATLGKAEAYSERADVQAAPEPSSQSGIASPTLDRIEVTGSRIGDDASDESRLAPTEWLERIRGYRDDGQAERARESLQRFRRAHPHARVPDDLRALLK
ncbi:MAG: hypothetical protein JF591_12090 [Lysobacter sp.]|nr:hypothetical protein [Lysobacter sp.]